MKRIGKTPTLLCHAPRKVVRDFAGVRGLVRRAVKASPQSISLSDALKQIQLFERLGTSGSLGRRLAG